MTKAWLEQGLSAEPARPAGSQVIESADYASATPIELAFLSTLVDPRLLTWAIWAAGETGVSPKSTLLAEGAVSDDVYYRALADRIGAAPFSRDLVLSSRTEIDAALRGGVAALQPNRHGLRALFAPRGEAVRELLRRSDDGDLDAATLALCSPRRFEALVRGQFRKQIAAQAANGLTKRDPDLSADRGLSGRQRTAIAAAACALAGLAWMTPKLTAIAASVALWTLFLMAIGLRAVAVGAGRTPDVAAPLLDEHLPIYSVLVPLHDEADMIPQLLGALEAIDYPRAKLDVKLVLEERDLETMRAVSDAAPPPWIDVVTIAPGAPTTKPRALNAALASARGDLLVIYDAEDIPDPAQLRAAAARFAAEPDLDCLQARLVVHNFAQSWLTRGIMAQAPQAV